MDNLMLGWLVRQLEDERAEDTSNDSEEEDSAQ